MSGGVGVCRVFPRGGGVQRARPVIGALAPVRQMPACSTQIRAKPCLSDQASAGGPRLPQRAAHSNTCAVFSLASPACDYALDRFSPATPFMYYGGGERDEERE
ncbi:unnamed protein product [Arctogadus glacialis]